MTIEIEKIFLGNTPADQRKFLLEALIILKKTCNVLYIPACGQFVAVKCGILAGFKNQNLCY